jgi:hypothetical protein
MYLSRYIHKNLIHTSLLDLLKICRQSLLYTGQNTAGFKTVRIQRNLVGSNILESIIMICPFLFALFPSRYVLADQLWAELLRFRDRNVPVKAECSSWVIDRYETLPTILSTYMRTGG